MSDRSIIQPDGALAAVLTDLSSRITRLDRRSQWPGAARVNTSTPSNPVGFPENTAAGSWPVGYNVATVTMDPGRWVLFSNVNVLLVAFSQFFYPTGGAFVGARINWTDGVASGSRYITLQINNPFARGLIPIALQVESKLPITATLNAYAGYNLTGYPYSIDYPNPAGEVSIVSPILIAFPG